MADDIMTDISKQTFTEPKHAEQKGHHFEHSLPHSPKKKADMRNYIIAGLAIALAAVVILWIADISKGTGATGGISSSEAKQFQKDIEQIGVSLAAVEGKLENAGTQADDGTPSQKELEQAQKEIKELKLEIQKLAEKLEEANKKPQPSAQPSAAASASAFIDDDAVLGDSDAPLLIVEFSDYQCPFCRKFWRETYPQIKKEYIDTGKAKLVFRDLPLSFHPAAQSAAEAAECAGDQDKYYEFHDKLFAEQDKKGVGTVQFGAADLKQWAQEIGLDIKEFNSCFDSGKHAGEVAKDIQDAARAGAQGTPFFIVNGKQISGAQPFAAFKQALDAAPAAYVAPSAAPEQKPEAQDTGEQFPTANFAISKIVDDDAALGEADAPVTIVEFSDYQCPFCEKFYAQTLPDIKKNYIDTGKVRLIYRDFPLGFHPEAQKAAEAAECAGKQGKYYEMHDKLFTNRASLSVSNYKKWAKEIGVDTNTFDACIDSGETAAEVAQDEQDGASFGIQGTPGFFIGKTSGSSVQLISGAYPYAAFEQVIEAALKE